MDQTTPQVGDLGYQQQLTLQAYMRFNPVWDQGFATTKADLYPARGWFDFSLDDALDSLVEQGLLTTREQDDQTLYFPNFPQDTLRKLRYSLNDLPQDGFY